MFLSPADARRIPALDGLRAVSIVLVLLSHVQGTPHFRPWPWLALFGDIGNLGVCVFFVLSGFLITRLLLDEMDRERRIDLAAFYRRRAVRILPAAAIYLLALAVFAPIAGDHLSSSDWLHALTLTMNYARERRWSVGHLWSLSVEEQFYLLWPLAMILLGRRRGLGLAAAALVAAPLWRTAVWMLWPEARDGIGETFPTVMDTIAAGCVLAGSAGWLAGRAWYRRFLSSPLFAVAPLVVLLSNAFARYPSVFLPLGMTARSVGIAAIVHWAVLPSNRLTTAVLSSPPFRFVGRISYSLYLWQQPFLNHHRVAPLTTFPANIVCACLCGVLSFRFVESPLLRRSSSVPDWNKKPRTSLAVYDLS